MADDAKMEAARKQLEANRAAAEKTREAQEKAAQGKPTPTQEENDLAKLGAHLTEHEDDGSPKVEQGPLTQSQPTETRQSTAQPAARGGYATRTATPAKTEP